METQSSPKELVFEMPSTIKTVFKISLLLMLVPLGLAIWIFDMACPVAIVFIFGCWVVAWMLPTKYVITDDYLFYYGKNILLQSVKKEVPIKEIARIETTPLYFILYNKYNEVIFKKSVNNFITPNVSNELSKRIH